MSVIWYINPTSKKRKAVGGKRLQQAPWARDLQRTLKARKVKATRTRARNARKARDRRGELRPLPGGRIQITVDPAVAAALTRGMRRNPGKPKVTKPGGRKSSPSAKKKGEQSMAKKGKKLKGKAKKAFLDRMAKGRAAAKRPKAKKAGAAPAGRKSKAAARKPKAAKSASRSAAAKKAAVTRAANKAARSARAKKAAATRAANKAAGKPRRAKRRKLTKKQQRRGVRSLMRARRAIRWERKHGRGRARAYIKRYRMRTNPITAVVEALKSTAPVAVGFFAGRALATKGMELLKARLPASVSTALGQHDGPVASLLAVVAAHYATKKIGKLAKYRTALMIGTSLNAFYTALKTYNPGGVAGYLGVGDWPAYGPQGAFPVATADYIDTSDYIEVGDYIETGAYEDVAAYEDLGTAVGGYQGGRVKMLGPIPRVASKVPIQRFPASVPAEHWSPSAEEALYTGVFAGGYSSKA